jgi:hypothetical protein
MIKGECYGFISHRALGFVSLSRTSLGIELKYPRSILFYMFRDM